MTDAGAAVWIIAVACFVLLAIGLYLGRRRQAARSPARRSRSDKHNAQVNSVREWLTDRDIVRKMIQTRTAGLEGLQATLDEIGALPEGEVAATVVLLLRHRDVRRVIATYWSKKYGLPHYAVMKGLAEWAAPEERDRILQEQSA